VRIAFIAVASGACAYLGAFDGPLISGLTAIVGATMAAAIFDIILEAQ
jgi:hypothetical protein